MKVRHTTRARRQLGLILPLALVLGACGQAPRATLTSPQAADSIAQSSGTNQSTGDGISQSSEINQSSGGTSQSTSQSSGGGVSQSTQINQSGGGNSSSVSTSRQVVDNGDGTVTIIETRQVDGHAESSRRTVKKSELDQGSSGQIIQQQIEQH